MRIFVLGSTGMIGRYVTKYFRAVGITRQQVDATIIRQDLFIGQFKKLNIKKNDVVINLIGITNKRNKESWEFLVVNSIFPRLVADYCENIGARMIHLSTDCVFSGAEGMYVEDDLHDEENIYGISKSAGEPSNCTVIRTSIIGENPNNNLDLLEWVRQYKSAVINGWEDHFWNGMTCLQFAKVCEQIIDDDLFWRGVRHIFSPDILSKWDVVRMINEIYGLNNVVRKTDSERFCDRTLSTSGDDLGFIIPPLKEQLIEQKNFKW